MGKYQIDLGSSNVKELTIAHLEKITNSDLSSIRDISLGYGNERGSSELRKNISNIYQEVKEENFLITHGGQEAFFLAMKHIYSKRKNKNKNKIIVINSGWPQHMSLPIEFGIEVEKINIGKNESIIQNLIGHISKSLLAIVISSPDNPTGRITSKHELYRISALLEKYNSYLIVDEEYLVDHYGESVACKRENIITTCSFSKMLALPGIRTGWIAASEKVINSCLIYKRNITITNPIICDSIANHAILHFEKIIKNTKKICEEGFNIISSWEKNNDHIKIENHNSYLPFCWVEVSKKINTLELARLLLEKGILIAPGEAFNKPGYIRITYARPINEVKKGIEKLDSTIKKPIKKADLNEQKTFF